MKDKKIDAKPTKELFITMLIRDISLNDAISDLIDNCVDGAIRVERETLKNKNSKVTKFSDMKVCINIKKDEFSIKDNCGGIDFDLAKKYAFRFGRPKKMKNVSYSVGQFGIGMKRAIFKMGKDFEIISTSKRSRFKVKIDVDTWAAKEHDWDFEFEEIHRKKKGDADYKEIERGTQIIVKKLNTNVRNIFGQEKYISKLIEEIELEHLLNLSKGLEIEINAVDLQTKKLKLIDSKQFKTAYWKKTYKKDGEIKAEVFAGIAEPSTDAGGWCIFCNDRMILGPDKSLITGWGARIPISIPKYHSQFNRFRGYVFFTAQEASLLPWNTSKNNIDPDTPIYRSVHTEMLRLHRQVINFLNMVHDESVAYDNAKIAEKKLENSMDTEDMKEVFKVKTNPSFKYPEFVMKKQKTEVLIKYIPISKWF